MIVGSLLLIVVAVGLLVLGLLQGSDALLVASIGASLLAAVALIVGGRQAAAARTARARTGRQVPSERYDPIGRRVDDDDDELSMSDLLADSPSGEFGLRAERQAVSAGARTGGTTYGSGGRIPAADETAMMPPIRDEAPAGIPVQNDEERYAPTFGAPGFDTSAYNSSAHDPSYDSAAYDDDDEYDEDDPADEPPIEQSSAADLARIAALDTDVLVIDGRPRYHVPSCPHLLGRESEPLPAHEAVELGFTPCATCSPNDALLAARR